MKKESEKQSITIHVDPIMAVSTIGLLRAAFPSIIANFEEASGKSGKDGLKFTKIEEMQEVLNEIYEKCIERTDVRERTRDMFDFD